MRSLFAAAALAGALLAPVSMAHAGQYSDALGKCIVSHTTDQDRLAFLVWFYQAMSAHPAVKTMSTVTEAQREASSKQAAELMQRLMTEDCRGEMVAVLRYEGFEAIRSAFVKFGEVAMETLASDPSVEKAMDAMEKYVDASKFEALGKEASGSKKP